MNNEVPGGHAPPGHTWGDKGSALPPLPRSPVQWRAGSVVEASWGIAANHGGGYAWRLCPKGEALTEGCFQRLVLPFAAPTQRLRLASGEIVEIDAEIVTDGTWPPGSAWARNPVPACRPYGNKGTECTTPQFPPPRGCDATCWGSTDNRTVGKFLPTVIDRLQLPQTLPPGEYVLGFRWDCEATAQVWQSCSDISITA